MRLIALMPVRNEAWCLGLTARAALMWCDALVVLNHASTDGSAEIIDAIRGEHPGRVCHLHEPDGVWEEMRHRQRLLHVARQVDATHIALIDADEILTGNLLPSIQQDIEKIPAGAIMQLPWLQLRDGIEHVMSSGMWGSSNVSSAFKDEPAFHWAARDGYDFHHRHPMGAIFRPWHCHSFRIGGLMHLQFASRRRLIAKQYLYQLIERVRWPNRKPVAEVAAMYTRTVVEAEHAQVERVQSVWWTPYWRLLRHLHIEAEPWQEAECRRLIAENPGITEGLNSFGLEL